MRILREERCSLTGIKNVASARLYIENRFLIVIIVTANHLSKPSTENWKMDANIDAAYLWRLIFHAFIVRVRGKSWCGNRGFDKILSLSLLSGEIVYLREILRSFRIRKFLRLFPENRVQFRLRRTRKKKPVYTRKLTTQIWFESDIIIFSSGILQVCCKVYIFCDMSRTM